jgi:hypothetical protein
LSASARDDQQQARRSVRETIGADAVRREAKADPGADPDDLEERLGRAMAAVDRLQLEAERGLGR